MNNINFHVSRTQIATTLNLVNFFVSHHKNNLNRFYIFPGGKSPLKFYNFLANSCSDWTNTNIMLSDERLVDKKSKYSNEYYFNKIFLNKINKDCKPNYKNISNSIKYIPDISILGIGKDGHTASLFPDHPEIFEKKNQYSIKIKNINESFERVSLTFNVLLKSKMIVFLILGKEKNKILKKIINGNYNPLDYPAQFIFKNYKKAIHLFCDKQAVKGINI